MDHFFDVFKRQTLSNSERESIKTRIRLFMAAHPPRIPWYIRFADGTLSTMHAADSRKLFGLPVQSLAFAFALVLCIGVGTTYASEAALPGDVLYPVKIHVRERVQGALAVGVENKVQWSATLTTRRLEEAESLAAQGRLTPAVSAEIESQINTSAENFNEHVAALAKNPGNDALVANAQSNLEASLNAHENVLMVLADQSSSTEIAIASVLSNVRVHKMRTKDARTKAEAVLTAQDSQRVENVARQKKQIAEGKVQAIRVAAEKSAKKLETDATGDTAARTAVVVETIATTTASTGVHEVTDAERDLRQADEKMNAGDYGKAFEIYQAAIRAADVTRLELDATARLRSEMEND
ncbi:MAG: hypothetical protein UY70_C0004G0024 [Candidatus Kaiserbacteria bacterium GW2011_GWB1_52_6]|uniref:DUF5667 domain-containing protein n=3 Tax=Candidatus Kaiseribacteriota TaxID=1752734 RepID=A0A0G1ZQ08_9BACT|nr:MAG: hypothetical protein UY67_C0020G0023 [Candidatus Kaiserbacteria bacterium GW2011_GWA2_52_12]KKW28040.1 MAG: hypothetical protein UY70_C0004G0024 [Candidatus Kaiserbacteria bacterium GW2011_GWB1_52_6]KKW30297.1 MAG: hypothetical protein UY74_C0045G0013 [Candidatus Kaiserbacteria bacterium GW2011_GWC2_52_8b]